MPAAGIHLIRQMAMGDRAAFSEFYNIYGALAYRLIVRIVGDRDDRVRSVRRRSATFVAPRTPRWRRRRASRNLPAAGAGKTYELWTIRKMPQPAGTFRVDDAGAAVVGIAPTGGPVDVFAITLEPAGGVPAPTGPIVLASGG